MAEQGKVIRRFFVSYFSEKGFDNIVIKFTGDRVTDRVVWDWRHMLEDMFEVKSVAILFYSELENEVEP
jgi:hypothetical protein